MPRLGRTDDTDQDTGIDKDLAEVLSIDGLSSTYSIRNLMGRQYLEHLNIFLTAGFFEDVWDIQADTPQEQLALMRLRTIKRRSLATWWANQQQAATPLSWWGLDAARIARAVYATPVGELRGALVQPDHGPALAPDYIAALLAARTSRCHPQRDHAPAASTRAALPAPASLYAR